MITRCIVTAFMCAVFPSATLAGADLTKVDRSIKKEPAYRTKSPKYCLLVFGPEAKTRVWLVLDGDTLYIDRNGNGDLTEQGERVPKQGDKFLAGDITEADGLTKTPIWLLSRIVCPSCCGGSANKALPIEFIATTNQSCNLPTGRKMLLSSTSMVH